MKPIEQLLKEVRDCEAEASEYAEIHHVQGVGLYGNIIEDYKAGHAAACDVLIPVILELLEQRVDLISILQNEYNCRMNDQTKKWDEAILAMLEKAVSK